MRWWERAVFYEVYVRSFQDSDGDGVGDLNGVASRVDYLSDLGVDAIWVTPFYRSPQVDFGYDISDHEDVDPVYGTLADFDRLVAAAHRRGLRLIVDIVLNHTSDQHPFFRSSRASRSSPHRDWYIWRDGRGDGPPNNWESGFGGPAWTRDPRTGQWYYHYFYAEQPDLNWRNPAVEERMLATLGFWLDRGVDGFRLDAVNNLFEDPDLRDNPPLAEPRLTLTGVVTQQFLHTRRLPEVHDVLRRVRGYVERRSADALLVSEAYLDRVGDLVRFYGKDDEVHLPFNFFLAQVPARDAAAFRRAAEKVEEACAERWPSLVFSNHDIDRACDRYSDDGNHDAVAKLLAAMLLTLRGTPFLYYGEEIAMRTHTPRRVEDVRDPVGKKFWPRYKGRDGVRTPMQWAGAPGAGFTRGAPWLPIGADAAERNVERQAADSRSVWTFCRKILHLRRTSAALRDGRYISLPPQDDVFAFARESGSRRMLIALNMADRPREASLGGDVVVGQSRWRVAGGTHRSDGEPVDLDPIRLEPLEVVIAAN